MEKSNLDVHSRSHDGVKLFRCAIKGCGKTYSSRHTLKEHHLGTHLSNSTTSVSPTDGDTKEKSVSALHANIDQGSTNGNFKVIEQRVIGGDGAAAATDESVMKSTSSSSLLKFPCQVCQKRFVNSKRLKRHLTTVHAAEKRHRCQICHKTFADKYALQPHMKIHYGDKQFPCGQCEKSFVQKVQLMNHLRSHTGEKPHRCEVCSKVSAGF